MSRMVNVAVVVVGVVLCGGYKTIFVPPHIDRGVIMDTQQVAPPTPAEPIQPDDPSLPDDMKTLRITVPVTEMPTDAMADTARVQLEQFYRMPIMDAPIELDPEMAFVPDPSVTYSMPVFVPEPGIVAPAAPEVLGTDNFVIIRGKKPPTAIRTPVPDQEPDTE